MVSLNLDSLKKWQDNNLEHIRYEYDLKPTDLVLDLGSYRREFADEIIKRYGCTVECFDALDNRAAWIFDGTIGFGGAYYYTSMFDENVYQYECVDIAKYITDIALMKINIEGGEYIIMDYIISKGLHTKVKNLQIQFHEVTNFDFKDRYDEIYKQLSLTHKLTWRYPFCWENWELL